MLKSNHVIIVGKLSPSWIIKSNMPTYAVILIKLVSFCERLRENQIFDAYYFKDY